MPVAVPIVPATDAASATMRTPGIGRDAPSGERSSFRFGRARRRSVWGVAVLALVASSCATATRTPSKASTTSTTGALPLTPVRLILTPTNVMVPVLRSDARGWRVLTPCGLTTTIGRGTPIRKIDVMLDPGHGGIESGAVGSGLKESDLNLDVALRAQRDLMATGIRAALTRTGDYRLPIATRAQIIDTAHPKLFVSVNHNGGPAADHSGPGTEVYYQHDSTQAKRLAGLIWESVYAALNQFPAHWVGASDAGAIYRLGRDGADFYGVLRLTRSTPGTLLEAAYVTEPSEGVLLGTPQFRSAEGAAIAQAIRRYLRTSDQGAGYHVPISRGFDDPGGGGGFNRCSDPRLQ